MHFQIKQRITNAWKGWNMESIGKAGIDEMLAKNPGSEVTKEQLSKIDMSRKGSSDLLTDKPSVYSSDFVSVSTIPKLMLEQLVNLDDEFFDQFYKSVIEAKKQRNEILGVTQTDEEIESGGDHKHNWKRGILPGSRYIKTCSVCFDNESVTFEEWQQIS